MDNTASEFRGKTPRSNPAGIHNLLPINPLHAETALRTTAFCERVISDGMTPLASRGSQRLARGAPSDSSKRLVAVPDALGRSGVHLAGWSYGCLACYAAIEQAGSERLRSVTMIDMTPGRSGQAPAGDGRRQI
jgi:pimeloyl-ACP methyl ester carboxylesterase